VLSRQDDSVEPVNLSLAHPRWLLATEAGVSTPARGGPLERFPYLELERETVLSRSKSREQRSGTSVSRQRGHVRDIVLTQVVDAGGLPAGRVTHVQSMAPLIHRVRPASHSFAALREALLLEPRPGRVQVRNAEKKIEAVA
jgi:hypothetical protein